MPVNLMREQYFLLSWNTLYQISISGVFVSEGPTSQSGQLQ
jgi:hypothetical protein